MDATPKENGKAYTQEADSATTSLLIRHNLVSSHKKSFHFQNGLGNGIPPNQRWEEVLLNDSAEMSLTAELGNEIRQVEVKLHWTWELNLMSLSSSWQIDNLDKS